MVKLVKNLLVNFSFYIFCFISQYSICKYVLFASYIDYEAVVKLSDGFNGADLRNVCTEAGLFAIRLEREYVIQEDFMKAVRKVSDNKKLESKLDYKPV